MAKVYEYLEQADCVITIALAVARKTIRQMTQDLLCYTCFSSGELAEKLGRYKMWKKKLKSPLAKQLSNKCLDILVYNCRIGHNSTITTEVNYYTISNYVYKYT